MTSATPQPTDPGLRHVRFLLRGQVQGVGFRWWTREQAQRLGITGDVRNCPDGTVQIHAQGRAAAIDAFTELLRRGPPGARVASVEEEPVEEVRTHSFEIVH